jgi:hypothetical protein
MKRVIAAVVLSVVLLSGCSVSINSKSNEPTPTPTNSTQAYVDNLRSASPDETEGVPDADLIETGRAACGAFDRGVTPEEIFSELNGSGIDPYFAGTVVGAAARYLCPEHEKMLMDYVDSHS